LFFNIQHLFHLTLNLMTDKEDTDHKTRISYQRITHKYKTGVQASIKR